MFTSVSFRRNACVGDAWFCVQSYLKEFAYGNTVGTDLWGHLQMVSLGLVSSSSFLPLYSRHVWRLHASFVAYDVHQVHAAFSMTNLLFWNHLRSLDSLMNLGG